MTKSGPQHALYDAVVNSALRGEGSKLHFCDAPGGTGKTFVERAIIAAVRAEGHAVVVCASSGVAATLLPDGRTFHSTFKVPVGADSDSQPFSVAPRSERGQLLAAARLIVWDEAPMQKLCHLDSLDRCRITTST